MLTRPHQLFLKGGGEGKAKTYIYQSFLSFTLGFIIKIYFSLYVMLLC
jgi:hypothetical protein